VVGALLPRMPIMTAVSFVEHQKKFHEAAKITNLPYEPDTDAIDRLMIGIYEMSMWKWGKKNDTRI